MAKRHDNSLGLMAFATTGSLLSVALLLGMMGGFILGALSFLIIVPSMTGLAIANGLEKGRLTRAGLAPGRAADVVAVGVSEVAIVARVVASEGACPLGYEFQIGDEWALNHEARGPAPLCPVACNRLLEARQRPQIQKDRMEKTVCQTERHTVAFEVRRLS